jgi:hypothetical protein
VFFKKNIKKINTLKKKIHVNSAILALFSEQWKHGTLFSEQCIMVEFSAQEKQHFSAFHLPAFCT